MGEVWESRGECEMTMRKKRNQRRSHARASGNGRLLTHSSSSEERRDAKGDLAPGPLFCVDPHFASMASYTCVPLKRIGKKWI